MPARYGDLAGLLGITIAALIVYFPCLRGGFLLDDNLLLTNNPLILAPDGLYRIWFSTEAVDYWPVANTSLWLEWRLWGANPTGYHVISLLLHISEGVLLWRILRRLAIPGAFAAALLFIVHPVNVETVAWIAQRKTLLAMLFLQLSVLAYLRSEEQRRLRLFDAYYGLSLLAFVLAMLSKVSAAVLPPLLVLLLYWQRPPYRRDWIRLAPFFVTLLVLLQVNLWFRTLGVAAATADVNLAERIVGAAGVVWFYLGKAIFPLNLAFLYPEWHVDLARWQWWAPLLATLLVTLVLWRYRDRRSSRSLWFAWLFFCLALVPVMGFIDVGFMQHIVVADHYQHVALIAVVTLIAGAWSALRRQQPHESAPAIVAVVVVVLLGLLSRQQSRLYADALTLYATALEKNPTSWLAHNNLGVALAEAGRWEEAIEQYETVLQLKPDHLEAQFNLGNALAQQGRLPEAIARYRLALQLEPGHAETHHNLGRALAQMGESDEALLHYKRALALRPDYPELYHKVGAILVELQRAPEAIEYFAEAVRQAPSSPDYHNNLGAALVEAGRLDEAIEQFRQALQLKPDFAEARRNLEIATARQQSVEAKPH